MQIDSLKTGLSLAFASLAMIVLLATPVVQACPNACDLYTDQGMGSAANPESQIVGGCGGLKTAMSPKPDRPDAVSVPGDDAYGPVAFPVVTDHCTENLGGNIQFRLEWLGLGSRKAGQTRQTNMVVLFVKTDQSVAGKAGSYEPESSLLKKQGMKATVTINNDHQYPIYTIVFPNGTKIIQKGDSQQHYDDGNPDTGDPDAICKVSDAKGRLVLKASIDFVNGKPEATLEQGGKSYIAEKDTPNPQTSLGEKPSTDTYATYDHPADPTVYTTTEVSTCWIKTVKQDATDVKKIYTVTTSEGDGTSSILRRKRVTVETYNSDVTGLKSGDTERRYETTVYDYDTLGRLKHIVSPANVVKMVTTEAGFQGVYTGGGVGPEDICDLDELETDFSDDYSEYVSVSFQYENASSETARVSKVTGASGCGSCGGASIGETSYSYIDSLGGGTGIQTAAGGIASNKAVRAIRIEYPNGLRETQYLNADDKLVLRIVQETVRRDDDDDSASNRVWVNHYVEKTEDVDGVTWTILETRTPEACTSYVFDSDSGWLALKGEDSNGVSESVVATASGLVRQSASFTSSGHGWVVERVKKGADATNAAFCVAAEKYGSGGANDPEWAVVATYVYPIAGKPYNDSTRQETTYAYSFSDGVMSEKSIARSEGVHDSTRTTSPGTTEYAFGILETSGYTTGYTTWTKYPDGSLEYEETDENRQVVTHIVDVDTDEYSSEAPDGWTNPNGSHRKTTYVYDAAGRMVKSTRSGRNGGGTTVENVTYLAYESVYSATYGTGTTLATVTLSRDRATSAQEGPIRIAVVDMGGNTLIQAAGESEAANSNLSGDWASTGTIGNSFTAFLSSSSAELYQRTTMEYDSSGRLWKVHRWSDAESVSTKITTTYGYDDDDGTYTNGSGRQEWVLSDGVYRFTQFDQQGNVIAEYVGTDITGATQSSPQGTTGNDLALTAQMLYDQSTPGSETDLSGTGNGNLTESRQYHGSESGDYYSNAMDYDYRGRQTHAWSPDGLCRETNLDNLGRASYVKTYLDGNRDKMAETNGHRSQSETKYDTRGNVYQSITYEVDPSTGSTDGSMATNYWYDAMDRVVMTEPPGSNVTRTRTKYTGAGDVASEITTRKDGSNPDTSDAWTDPVVTSVIRATHYKYDGLGRKTEQWLGESASLNESSDEKIACWEYLAHTFLLSEAKTIRPNKTSGGQYVATQYTYDSMGRTATRTTPGDEGNLQEETTYDDLGRVTLTELKDGSTVMQRLGREYVANRNQLNKTVVYDVSDTNWSTSQQTTYGYDDLGRQNEVTQPTDLKQVTTFNLAGQPMKIELKDATKTYSITTYAYDDSGRQTSVSVGTDAGTPGDMQVISKRHYHLDSNEIPCASNETGAVEQGRLVGTAELKPQQSVGYVTTTFEYDGYGRRYRTTLPDPDGSSGSLSAVRQVTSFDDAGRVSERVLEKASDDSDLQKTTIAYTHEGVSSTKVFKPGNGTTDYQETTRDYGPYGRLAKVTQPSGKFVKFSYDLAGNVIKKSIGTDEGGLNEAENVSGDTLLQQTVLSYSDAGQVIFTKTLDRKDGDTATGDLDSSNARITRASTWYDPMGRVTATYNQGTGGSNDARPSRPTSRDAATEFIEYTYSGYGQIETVTDNASRITKTFYDSHGRREYVVENENSFDPNSVDNGTNDDENRATQYVYDALGLLKELVAYRDGTSKQTTRYVYAHELTEMGCTVKRPDLLRAVIYPDGDTAANVISELNSPTGTYTDFVEYTYHANGARRTATDQRGIVHTYTYDLLGRLTQDQATHTGTWPASIDGTIRTIVRQYDEQHLISVQSLDLSDTVKNEVQFTRGPDGWGNVTASKQAHAGSVDTSTPSVQYDYDQPAAGKPVRLEKITYPNGDEIAYNYGPSTSGADATGFARVTEIARTPDGETTATDLATYRYMGSGMVTKLTYPQVTDSSSRALSLDYGTDATSGLDALGRVTDHRWRFGSDGTVVDRYTYGYDAASNRTFRKNVTAPATYHYDEFHTYDGLNRLKTSERGDLNTGNTGIDAGTHTLTQQWTLDLTGNWSGFKNDAADGSTWDLDQTRQHNDANEIDNDNDHTTTQPSTITETAGPSWITPAHDAAGNMTTIPRTGMENTAFSCTYDAWNRLVKVTQDANVLAEYTYDGLHRQVTKTFQSGAYRVDYYYNTSWQMLETTITLNSTQETRVWKAYVWDLRYIDSPICRLRDMSLTGSLDETLYYLNDANFNVTAVMIEDSGSWGVRERYLYDPYGQVTVLNGSADADASVAEWTFDADNRSDWANELLFAGYRHMPETAGLGDTGLYHVRHRAYHPTLSRWLQRDPAGYMDGLNAYLYCFSRPTLMVDPSGLGGELSATDAEVRYKLSEMRQTDPDATWEDAVRAVADIGDVSRKNLVLEVNGLSTKSVPKITPRSIFDDKVIKVITAYQRFQRLRKSSKAERKDAWKNLDMASDDAWEQAKKAFPEYEFRWTPSNNVVIYDITVGLRAELEHYDSMWKGVPLCRKVLWCKFLTDGRRFPGSTFSFDLIDYSPTGQLSNALVAYDGKVYKGHQVNYVLYGHIRRRCKGINGYDLLWTSRVLSFDMMLVDMWKAKRALVNSGSDDTWDWATARDWAWVGLLGVGKPGSDMPPLSLIKRIYPGTRVIDKRNASGFFAGNYVADPSGSSPNDGFWWLKRQWLKKPPWLKKPW